MFTLGYTAQKIFILTYVVEDTFLSNTPFLRRSLFVSEICTFEVSYFCHGRLPRTPANSRSRDQDSVS